MSASYDLADNFVALRVVEALTTVFFVLFVVVTALRLYARTRLLESGFRLDDTLLCVSTTFGIATCITNYIFTGLLRKTNISDESRTEAHYGKAMTARYLAANILPEICIGFLALSILSLYHRLSMPNTFLRKATYILPVFVIVFLVPYVMIGVFQCVPLRKLWNVDAPGRCVKPRIIYRGFIIYLIGRSALTILIYVLPIRHFWMLEMPRRKRYLLIGMFTLGGISCVCNLAIIVLLVMAGPATKRRKLYPCTVLGLKVTEIGFALLCASGPSLRVYLGHLRVLS